MTLTTTDVSQFIIQTKNTAETTVIWTEESVTEKNKKNKTSDAVLCSIRSGCSSSAQLPSIAIDHPGEYEFKGIFVIGESCELIHNRAGVFFAVDTEGIRILAIPDSIKQPFSQEEYAKIGSVDIIITSTTTESVTTVADIVNQSEPRIVITNEHSGVDVFVKKIGLQAERVSKLKVTKKDLPQDRTACYILTNE